MSETKINHTKDMQILILTMGLLACFMLVLNGLTDAESSRAAEARGFHDVYLHKMWSFYSPALERQVADAKDKALHEDNLQGDILEIGTGHGVNFARIKPHANIFSWTAIEPNVLMHDKLHAAAKKAYLKEGTNFTVLETPFLQTDLEDESYDVVLATFSLCEFGRDIHAALDQIFRVLKPSGTLVFVEHSLKPRPGNNGAQALFSPVWRTFTGSCPLTTPVVDAIKALPWKDVEIKRLDKGAHKVDVTPVYYGVATKATAFDDFVSRIFSH